MTEETELLDRITVRRMSLAASRSSAICASQSSMSWASWRRETAQKPYSTNIPFSSPRTSAPVWFSPIVLWPANVSMIESLGTKLREIPSRCLRGIAHRASRIGPCSISDTMCSPPATDTRMPRPKHCSRSPTGKPGTVRRGLFSRRKIKGWSSGAPPKFFEAPHCSKYGLHPFSGSCSLTARKHGSGDRTVPVNPARLVERNPPRIMTVKRARQGVPSQECP